MAGGIVALVISIGLAALATAMFWRPDGWRYTQVLPTKALFGTRRRRVTRSVVYWDATVVAIAAIGSGWYAIASLLAVQT